MKGNMGFVSNIYGNRVPFLGDKTAVYDFDSKKKYSYTMLDQRSDRVAAYLTKVMGVKKGDRVSICALNRVEFFDLFFAAYKTGIILSTYNGKLMDWELARLIHNETPKVIFTDRYYNEKMLRVHAQTAEDRFVLVNLDEDTGISYRDMLNTEEDPDTFDPDPEDILMLIHTGGTTGLPKAAMLSYRSIVFNSISTVLSHGLTDADTTYLMLPLFHTAAWNSISLGAFLAGGEVIIKKAFNDDDAYQIIEEERPSFLLGVPTIYKRMAEHPKFHTTDFSCIKSMRCGAAPLPMSLFEIYDAKNLPLCNSYGLTECGPSNFSFPMRLTGQDVLRAKAGFVGRPYYFNRVRVVDEEDRPLPPNTPGELQFSGPLVFSGYWNNEEETRLVTKGEWTATGDIAIYDEEGFYKIIGRKKNMFISGGENIFPIEIENVLMRLEAVQDCAVIGVEDSHWGEVGKAFIQVKTDCVISEKEIYDYLKRMLPTIKIPKYIVFIDRIPRNDVGKLLLETLREMK